MLSITLKAMKPELEEGATPDVRAIFRNQGAEPLAVPLWWTYRLRIVEAARGEVAPGPGPVLPCGIAENVQLLDPGKSLVHGVRFEATQPAGMGQVIGWKYDLAPGRYRLVLIYEAPIHRAGPVESNEVGLTVLPRPRTGRLSFLARLFWRRSGR